MQCARKGMQLIHALILLTMFLDGSMAHDRADGVETMVVDDVIWILTICIIVGAIIWLCLFLDTPVSMPPSPPVRHCCNDGRVIHVLIEHPTKKENSRFTPSETENQRNPYP